MMGYWPLCLESGGILWGGDQKSDLLWGDPLADIIDELLQQFVNEAYKQTMAHYRKYWDRDMTQEEFAAGLCFSIANLSSCLEWLGLDIELLGGFAVNKGGGDSALDSPSS